MSSSGGTSRQRNCNACVRSKRRCDKGQPACGRCVKQRYPCVYGGRRRTQMAFGESADTTFSLGGLADPTPDSCAFMPTSNTIPTMLGNDMDLPPDATFHLHSDFSSLLAAIPENNSFLPDPWASPFTGLSSTPREKALVRKDYSKMTPMCDDYAPWQLSDPSTKAAFTLSMMKKLHVKFAQNSCTLYIHRYLYKDNMPRCILQAFTMCLLYTNQTEANRGVVLRVLHDSVTELKAGSSSKNLVPQRKLARVHALMFYQAIRMFDGDITLGQQADDDMELLESWNNELCKVSDDLEDLVEKGDAAREHPPESWEVSVDFRGDCKKNLYNVHLPSASLGHVEDTAETGRYGRLEFCSPSLDALQVSIHLWNAQNSFDFFRAWKEQPFYIITTFNFDDFLKIGTGDDLDEFAFYFLTLYFGVNEIKSFCHETSGHILALT
ncbi:hypothetical protein F4860DRAFT_526908 [Xylaria cubensis]|nr:hypothetical protein F4860DRAFT_526908 [Xylaria cubensis]